jgi:hypothetical protein
MQTRLQPPMAAAARKTRMKRYAYVVVKLAQAAVLLVPRTAEVVSNMVGPTAAPVLQRFTTMSHNVTSKL